MRAEPMFGMVVKDIGGRRGHEEGTPLVEDLFHLLAFQ